MALSHILLWASALLLHFTIGYHIAKVSLEVYDKWGKPEDNTFSTWGGLRVLLFPLNSLNLVWAREPEWLLVGEVRTNQKEVAYIMQHMFYLWPIRMVWYLGITAIFYVIIPVVSLPVLLMVRMFMGLVNFVVGLFQDSRSAMPSRRKS